MDTTEPKPVEPTATPPEAEPPKGMFRSALTMMPIVLTILATAFAGMSSSEMTQSMYYRSLAAQHQSKAGDQWAFFQAKRIRGTSLETTVDLLQSLGQPEPFDPAQWDAATAQVVAGVKKATADEAASGKAVTKIEESRKKLAKLLGEEKTKQSLVFLTGFGLPESEIVKMTNKDSQKAIEEVVKEISKRKTESETADAIRRLNPADIEEGTRVAEQNADNFDKACEPINDTVKEFRNILRDLSGAVKSIPRPAAARTDEKSLSATEVHTQVDGLNKSFKAMDLGFTARRYRKEADLNRAAAEMYEVRVRRSGVESDRHRDRSKLFFYSMLVAQVGVTIASLALARTQRNSLWLFAAVAGLTAVGFSSYVYVAL